MSAQVLAFSLPLATATAWPVVSHPLHAALRSAAEAGMQQLCEQFSEQLDSGLQGLIYNAHNAAETRIAVELGDALALARQSLQRRVLQAFSRRFEAQARPQGDTGFDLSRLTLLPSEEMEENIALTHLSQLAEHLAGEPGRQLQARLQWAARDLGLPALAQAFAANAVGECFATALRAEDLNHAQRVMACRLIESHALPQWPAVVAAALAVLDQHGLRFPRPANAPVEVEASPPPRADAERLALAASRARMQACLTAAVAGGGMDARFASECLRQVVQGGPVVTVLCSVSEWLDGLIAEPQTPAALVPQLETLRFALLKAAVADRSFFSAAAHPVRRLLSELLEKAAYALAAGTLPSLLLREVQSLAERLNISAAFAQDYLAGCQPLSADELFHFRDRQMQDQALRLDSLLLKVRCLAMREIETRTLGCQLPEAAQNLLSAGFMPLLAAALLRQGAGSDQEQRVAKMIEDFLASYEPGADPRQRDAQLLSLRPEFAELGLREDRVARLLAAVAGERQPERQAAASRSAVALAPAAAAAPLVSPDFAANQVLPSAAAVDAALHTLLRPEGWFRVRDNRSGDDRFLCISAWYPQQDSLSFRSANSDSALGMRASRFLEDLISGRAEPLNPSAAVAEALKAMRASRAQSAQLVPQRASG